MAVWNLITGNFSDEYDKEHVRKTVTVNLFSLLAILSLLIFGTLRLKAGEMTAAFTDYGILTIILINFVYLRISKNIKVSAQVVVVLVFILMMAIFLIIGKNGTGLYWYYIFPLFSIFLLGNIWGGIYSALLMIITAYLLKNPPEFAIEYPQEIFGRVIFTYTLVLLLTIIYENVREKTRKAFVKMYSEKSEYLEETLLQKEEIMAINEQLDSERKTLAQRTQELEEINQHVTDSINYAKIIQDALLTKPEIIEALLPDEHFILFKPKEIVSGDFYYVNKIDNNLIFAAADCTGHGVAGGFITMLGITHLHRIIKDKRIANPADALELLRERIKGNFKSFGSENKSGLDIALCVIDTNTNILQYAGAYNPLFIFRDDELLEYQATRNPIGFYPKEIPFKSVEIQLQNDDMIYVFSDGYYDQVNENNRKYKKSRFKDYLHQIHQLPAIQQKEKLEAEFNAWKGSKPQIDDITVMGMRWKI